MKFILALCLTLLSTTAYMHAGGPQGRTFGFGLIAGEPYGGTVKFWSGSSTAVAIGVGGSYYGSLRVGGDYLWHFDAFNSSQFNLYAGPGVVLGFGTFHNGWWYTNDRWVRASGDVGVAIRGVVGVDFSPRNSAIEMFVEAGPLVNLSPGSFSAFDFAIGARYYP